LYEAAELLHEQEVLELVGDLSLQIVNATIQNGWDLEAGGIWDGEQSQGVQSNHKTWWPQAEAMVGFLNAFQLSEDPGYLAYMQQTWALIDRAFKDPQGEWHWEIFATEQPNRSRDKAGFWKSPYHNARMCMEMISRIEDEIMEQHFDPH
jgi:mannobiose 2-epimerase